MAQKLYDKASLVMIPSQYKEGRLFNIKPEDQAKSFEFERGSVATRVNSNGLIDYPGVKNTEIIVNGHFTGGSTNWVLNQSWTYNNNRLFFDKTQNRIDNILQLNQWTLSQGKYYLLSFDIENVDQNDLSNIYVRLVDTTGVGVQDIASNYERYGDGTVKVVFTPNADSPRIDFYARGNVGGNPGGSFYMDNVSIKELSIVPRLDHSGTEAALLLEPQRTNEVTYSQVFNSSSSNYFGPLGATIDSTTETAPDGTTSASTMLSTGQGKVQTAYRSLPANTTYTLSVYVKNVDATSYETRILANGGSGGTNITQVSRINEINTTSWTRVTHTFTTHTTAQNYIMYISNNVSSGQSVQLWGAQLEQGSYATSYIPTRGQTKTRLKDICYGGGDESVFNTTAGTLFIDLEKVAYESNVYSLISLFADGSNYIWLGYNRDFNRLYAAIRNNANNTLITTGTDLGVSRAKMALMYSSGNSKIFVNGSQIISDTDALNFTANFQELRFNYSATYNVNSSEMKTSAVAYFPEALSDTELQELTSIT
jgi:hypothetical protein